MDKNDAEEFTQSLGQLVSGSWRQIALAKRLGVPKALGLDVEDWVRDRLGGYVKYSVAERREAVAELAAEGLSQRAIAEVVGVGEATVRRDIDAPNGAQADDSSSASADAAEAPAPNGAPKPHVTNNSGENEWYTPAEYVEAARAVLGGIDLDPASSPEANSVVKATTFYSIADDGLSQAWAGRVWMNPPYSGGLIEPFCRKLVEHVAAGDVEAACVLVNNATDTGWFQDLLAGSTSVCLLRGRVKYWYPGRGSKTPLQGQVMLYFGPSAEAFADDFRSFGRALRPWNFLP